MSNTPAAELPLLFVPVDFSPASDHAARYAVMLARLLPARLHFFHAWKPDVLAASPGSATRELDETCKQLEAYALSLVPSPSIPFTCSASMLEPAATIISETHVQNAALIVMGSIGATGLKEKLVGSTTLAVLDHSRIPVLSVPLDCAVLPPSKLLLASDGALSSLDAISYAARVAGMLSAQLSFVHVGDPKQETAFDQAFTDAVHFRTQGLRISFETWKGHDVFDGLNRLLQEEENAWLALVQKEHGLLHRLFNPGIVHRMKLHGQTPLLVLHEKRGVFFQPDVRVEEVLG